MQSKTSFFNKTLFRKNLTRFWPLWTMPSFIGALFPLALLTQMIRYGRDGVFGSSAALEVTGAYYEIVTYVVPILSLCYAILVAIAVWSYLFSSRSVGMMHTLPLRREGVFLTNFLSGMAMMLIPYAATGALCIIISVCFGFFEPVGLLITILCVMGESLFYFASATLVAFITGNLFAMPVLYFIFHFLAVGLDALVNLFANGFLFGVNGSYSGVVEFLSPTVYLVNHVNADRTYVEVFVPDAIHGSSTPDGIGYYTSKLTAVSLDEGWLIAVYALVGVVLLGLAYALYRKRRSESAGDVVAVGWMKPVFRYGVAICGSMLGGLALYAVFWGSFQNGSYYDIIPLVIAMLIAGAISYYAASMLLAKSLRVFRGSWRGLAVTAVCAVAICCTLHFDLFGVETRVPKVNQVEYVTLYVADNHYTFYPEQDAELLEELRAVHLAIAEDKDYITAMEENWRYDEKTTDPADISMYNSVRLGYYLKNGTTVTRRYSIPIVRSRIQDPSTYDYQLTALINSEAMKARRFHLDDGYVPNNGYIYLDASEDGGTSFGNREAQAILEAVRKDVEAGVCGTYDWFDSDRGGDYAMDLTLEFTNDNEVDTNGTPYRNYDSIGIRVRPEMTNTVNTLLELGLATRENLKTYLELYPQDYLDDLEYAELMAEKFGTYEMPAYSEAASIGVIGGADGPTAVYVTAG